MLTPMMPDSARTRLNRSLLFIGVAAVIVVPSLFAETPAAHDLTRRDRVEAATTVMNKEGKPLTVNGTGVTPRNETGENIPTCREWRVR